MKSVRGGSWGWRPDEDLCGDLVYIAGVRGNLFGEEFCGGGGSEEICC